MDNLEQSITFFKKLRDVSAELVEAFEEDKVEEVEVAMGKFMVLMMQADALK